MKDKLKQELEQIFQQELEQIENLAPEQTKALIALLHEPTLSSTQIIAALSQENLHVEEGEETRA